MTISYVRDTVAEVFNATSKTITITAPASGNYLVLTAGANGYISTVTGGGVSAWSQLRGAPYSLRNAEIWYGRVDTTPTTSVTVTFAVAKSAAFNVSEWSTSTPFVPDITATATATSTTKRGGSVTPSNVPALALSTAIDGTGVSPSAGPTGGFTALTQSIRTTPAPNEVNNTSYLIVTSSPAAVDPTWTITSDGWEGVSGVLREAVTGDVVATERGQGGVSTGTTTMTITPASTLPAGSFGVLVLALDNAGSGGATAAAPSTITDSAGNTWTRRVNPIYDPGAASAGVETACYTADIGTALTGDIVVTWAAGVTVTAKAYTLQSLEIQGGGTFAYVTGAAGTGAASGSPTVTTGSITSGDVVIGFGGSESADTWFSDVDTTNGPWAAQQHAATGTGTSGMAVTSQRKVVTATATQTYNPTLTSADQILGWVQIRPTASTPSTSWAGRLAPTVALQAVSRAGSW